MKKRVALFLLFLCWAAPARADAPRLSREQAAANALAHHPSMRRFQALNAAARARERRAEADFHPRLSLEAVTRDGPAGSPNFSFLGLANSGSTQGFGGDAVLSQIFDFGRTAHRARSRRFAVAAATADLETQQARVLLGLDGAYDDTLLACALQALAERNLQMRQYTVRQAAARFRAGLTSRVDVDLARAGQADASVTLVRARASRQVAFATLNAAMGVTAPPEYALQEVPEAPAAVRGTLAEDVATALRQRPESRSMDAQVQAAGENVRAAQADSAPTLRVLASGGYLHVPRHSVPNHSYAVGLGVSVPVYTGGAVAADADTARHEMEAVLASREELRQDIQVQVTRARLTLEGLIESRAAVQEAVAQATDSEKLARLRYHHGLGNILEVQQAQVELFQAQTRAARLRYDTVTAWAALRYAVGDLAPPAAPPARPPHGGAEPSMRPQTSRREAPQ